MMKHRELIVPGLILLTSAALSIASFTHGQIWGDDFAAYLMQARGLSVGLPCHARAAAGDVRPQAAAAQAAQHALLPAFPRRPVPAGAPAAACRLGVGGHGGLRLQSGADCRSR